MYKEAQAAPPPSPIGGITVVCGSRTQDYLSARPPPPRPLFVGCGILVFYEEYFLVLMI
jgi:hypothetical protein